VRAGAVLYVAAERAKLVERRLAAFRKHHGVPDAALAIVAGVFNMVGSQDDTSRLIDTAFECASQFDASPAWIIVDTTAQVMGGGDENSSKDMSAFVANLGRLQAKTGAHVSAVHHVPHFAPDRMRGHGALIGALDTSILIEKNGGHRTVSLKKVNDGPDDLTFAFDLEGVTLSTDPDSGKETSAPVVKRSDEAPEPRERGAKEKRLPASLKVALDALSDAITETGERVDGVSHIPRTVLVVSEEQWRQNAYDRRISPSDTPEAQKKAFNRARTALVAAGKVATWGGRAWLTERDANAAVAASSLSRKGSGT
jgi:hypothetical protein